MVHYGIGRGSQRHELSAAARRSLDGRQDAPNVVHSGQCTALEATRLAQLRRPRFRTARSYPIIRIIRISALGHLIAICYRLWARQLVFFIHLNGTAATDAGLLELKRCKTLTRVSVQSTAVTAAGAKELKAALPNVSVGR